MVALVANACRQRLGLGFHLCRNRVRDCADADSAFADTVPGVDPLPCAIQQGLHPLDVIGAPVVDDRRNARGWRIVEHVGRLTEADDTRRLGAFGQGRSAVGVGKDNIDALFDQRLGGIGLFRRVEPGIGPDHRYFHIGVDLAGMDKGGIDAHHHFGNRERPDIADLVRFGHAARDGAHDGAPLIKPGIIGGDVGGQPLEAGGMFKLHIGKFGGDVVGGIHIAERRGENDLAP